MTQRFYIPPNGFAGQAQQTTANQLVGAFGARARGAPRKRRKVAVNRRAKPAKRRASSRRPARLVKGSRAAKAYMAKIRRKRK